MVDWQKAEIAEVSLEMGTDIKAGRVNMDPTGTRNGQNKVFSVPSVVPHNVIRHIASDASFILLAITYIVAAGLGYFNEAIIALPVLWSYFVASFYIKFLSERRISDSNKLLIPHAKVIENGQKIRLSALDVEVGDLIYFTKGDIIPADARLVSSTELYMAERFYNEISGKSEYRRFKKDHEALYADNASNISYANMVYASSMVVSGKGSAIVTAIGSNTKIGSLHDGISLVSDKDRPYYFKSFRKLAKGLSLSVLLSIVPMSLLLIYLTAEGDSFGAQNNILYTFLVLLAASVSSMSELIASPSELIVSYALFKNNSKKDSGVTKLSSAEKLSETDTLLILCPEVLKDKRKLLRRIVFSDKEYRFDLLKSDELQPFSTTIATFYKYQHSGVDNSDLGAIKHFLLSVATNSSSVPSTSSKIRLLRNFPIEGARTCVFATDDEYPIAYLSQSNDVNIVLKCDYFKTEGGSKWQFGEETRKRIFERFNEYLDLGLKVYLYVSKREDENSLVFEGMLAIGEEYPFSNKEVFNACKNADILPVLILENENDETVRFAINSGIINNKKELALASEFAESGQTLECVDPSYNAYIGFGHEGTREIVKRLSDAGRNILPIIKDSSDRNAVSPISVYATHAEYSYDSIKIASSLMLSPPDAETRVGGIADALRCIGDSAFARLKLASFRNYLIFVTFLRLFTILISLIFSGTAQTMTALMILLCGVPCDMLSLLVFATVKGSQANIKIISRETNKKFNALSGILYSVGGILTAICLFAITRALYGSNIITESNCQIFSMYSVFMIQICALISSMLLIKKRVQGLNRNIALIIAVTVAIIYLPVQCYFGGALNPILGSLAYSIVDLIAIPFIILSGAIAFSSVLLIDKVFTSYTKN